MSYVRSYSKTVTLGTTGGYSGYTTEPINGLLYEVYMAINIASGAGNKVTITTTSTGQMVLKVVDPSTLGAWYYPRVICHGSTANTLETSTDGFSCRDKMALADGRFKVITACTSALAGAQITMKFKVV